MADTAATCSLLTIEALVTLPARQHSPVSRSMPIPLLNMFERDLRRMMIRGDGGLGWYWQDIVWAQG